MTYEVRLAANAQRDYDRHVNWFAGDENLIDRIDDFTEDLLATLEFIGEYPLLRREVYLGVRHEALRVFSYHVWFRTYEGAEFVDVFAIVHQAADPNEVESRLT